MIMAKDSNNNYVKIEDIKQQNSFNGVSPIEFKGSGENLENYRIYGNTIDDKNVGDRIENLFDKENIQRGAILAGSGYDGLSYSESVVHYAYGINYDINRLCFKQLLTVTGINTISISGDYIFMFVEFPNGINSGKKSDWYSQNTPLTIEDKTFALIIKHADERAISDADIENIELMINKGSTALPYEPYYYRVPVTVKGKNLFDVELTDSYHLDATTGLPVSFVRRFATLQPITINQSEYCLTYNSTTDLRFMYSVFNNDTLIRRMSIVNNRYLQSGDAIDTTGGNKIYFAFFTNDYSQATTSMISNIMLNAGSTALPYEPYHAPVTTPIYLPEQIRKVGDEAEYIDYAEQKLHRVRKNLLQNTATSQTINGVTFTVNNDGSITCNGTANVSAPSILYIPFTLPIKLYELSGCPDSGSDSTYRVDIRNIDYSMHKYNGNSVIDDGTGCLFDGGNNQYCIRIAPGYTCDNLTFYPMIRKADIEDDTYEPYIENTDLDVTLPALPTLSGTNTLSVGTEITPSKVWGRLSDPRDIEYVKDNLGNILFSKYHEVENVPPLTYKAIEGTLKNYRIYGNTVNAASVGDRTANLFDKTNFIQTNLVSYDGENYLLKTDPYTISTVLPCNPNTKYTISKIVTNRFAIWGCTDYPTNNEHCNGRIISDNDSSSLTFTTGNNDNYLLIMLFYQRQPTDPTIEDVKKSIMYNYGDALPYEPYGCHIPVTVTNGTNTETTNIYLDEPLGKSGDDTDYIDYKTQKRYNIDGTSIDVTLPALPTVAGMNILSVGTQVQPSKINIKGKIKGKIYGWHVNPDISNSSNAVTYLEDAIGMTPASMGSTTFDYGSWENAFFMPKPCMLKSNGKVDYYLDPNDYTKKLNGTASDISNPNYDGNAMMEWPKIWFKYVKGVKEGQGYFYVANYKADGNFHCWCNYDSENNEIDHFYTAIYNGTSFANYSSSKTYVINDFVIYDNKLYKCNTDIATAESFDNTKWDLVSNTAPAIDKMRSLSDIRLTNNNGNAQTTTTTEVTRATANNTTSAAEWYIETFSDRLLINGLLVLMGKSLNTQAVFGRGLDAGGVEAKEAYVTGALNDKGLFYGVTGNGNSAVKVFGMENFWGCVWHRTAGLITNNHAIKLKLTYGTKDGSTVVGYNQTGNGYIDNGISPYTNGYVQKMSYNKYGFIPAVVTGRSQSTYYADYHYQNATHTGIIYALFGGHSLTDLYAGAFYQGMSASPEHASWGVAASLSCKPLLN